MEVTLVPPSYPHLPCEKGTSHPLGQASQVTYAPGPNEKPPPVFASQAWPTQHSQAPPTCRGTSCDWPCSAPGAASYWPMRSGSRHWCKSGQVLGLQEHPSLRSHLGATAFSAGSTCAASPGRIQGSSVSAGPLVYAAHSSFLWLGWARMGQLASRHCSYPFCSWTLAAPRGLHSGERVTTAGCGCVLHRLLVLEHFSRRG